MYIYIYICIERERGRERERYHSIYNKPNKKDGELAKRCGLLLQRWDEEPGARHFRQTCSTSPPQGVAFRSHRNRVPTRSRQCCIFSGANNNILLQRWKTTYCLTRGMSIRGSTESLQTIAYASGQSTTKCFNDEQQEIAWPGAWTTPELARHCGLLFLRRDEELESLQSIAYF